MYRAYLLKEPVRLLLKRPLEEVLASLGRWLVWASDSRLKSMVRFAKSIRRVRAFIDATLEHGLNNGRVESVNAKICSMQQRAFGFHHPSALVALAKLTLSGFRSAMAEHEPTHVSVDPPVVVLCPLTRGSIFRRTWMSSCSG